MMESGGGRGKEGRSFMKEGIDVRERERERERER